VPRRLTETDLYLVNRNVGPCFPPYEWWDREHRWTYRGDFHSVYPEFAYITCKNCNKVTCLRILEERDAFLSVAICMEIKGQEILDIQGDFPNSRRLSKTREEGI
jgi:hypothetical protein